MDRRLMDYVRRFGENSWNRISKLMNKSEIKCNKRYLVLSNRQEMASANWSKEEDEKLASLVLANGAKDWTKIASQLPGRIGKQCRERWHHHLNPDVVKKKWTLEEDTRIVRLYLKYGTRWAEIARHVDGRTDNQVKNRFNANLKKRMNDPEFRNLKPAESSCEPGSEDSVTFDGDDDHPDCQLLSKNAKPKAVRDASTLKTDEPSMQVDSTTAIEPFAAGMTLPLSQCMEITHDAGNETMPLILACKQRRESKLALKRATGSTTLHTVEPNNCTYDMANESS